MAEVLVIVVALVGSCRGVVVVCGGGGDGGDVWFPVHITYPTLICILRASCADRRTNGPSDATSCGEWWRM